MDQGGCETAESGLCSSFSLENLSHDAWSTTKVFYSNAQGRSPSMPPPLLSLSKTPTLLCSPLHHPPPPTLSKNPHTLHPAPHTAPHPGFQPLHSPPALLPPTFIEGGGLHAGVQGWAEQAARHVEEVATFRAGGLPASVRTIAHCGFTGTVAYSLTGWLVLSPCLSHPHCVWPVSATLPACMSMRVCLCL